MDGEPLTIRRQTPINCRCEGEVAEVGGLELDIPTIELHTIHHVTQ